MALWFPCMALDSEDRITSDAVGFAEEVGIGGMWVGQVIDVSPTVDCTVDRES